MAFKFFGKPHVSNSDIADKTHSKQTEIRRQEEEPETKMEEKEAVTWTRMIGYPLFSTDSDEDGDWQTAKCSRCQREFAYDDWYGHDEFYMALDLHEIKHHLEGLSKIASDG